MTLQGCWRDGSEDIHPGTIIGYSIAFPMNREIF